ncbi:heme peroxidase [Epithele typhae]|uniref:heme peroxidase n=1 Tax=Epithele typhae TaxID=378194 RepID=UPI002007D2A2|nr:heme peroxidase [Epithele typhae]KAH9940835.1 heme peroxidase [Epithele typhae]
MSTLTSKLARRFSTLSVDTNDSVPPSPSTQPLKGFQAFKDKIKEHMPFASDVSNIEGIVDLLSHPDGIDDRKMLLEHTLVFLSNNAGHPLADKLQNAVIQLLYNDLPHPPDTFVGNQYAFRTADGSNNDPSNPDLGKAGTPYSRSVTQTHPLPVNELPDPGLVFDTLLRREKFIPHPAGLSSTMFAFAALVIHTVFRTSHNDVSINGTSSYVDLAPLYGNSEETLKKIRVFDGRGLLVADTFAEDRLLLLPPPVCVLLVLFNRNHNYIANKLLELNERRTYNSNLGELSQKELFDQEESIFQTARLINCGWFGAAVFSDYVAAILGLVRQGSSWSLNPFEEMRNLDHSLFERGRGNSCSVEFNCLYRWHATTSEHDALWVEEMGKHLFGDKALTIQDFKDMAQQVVAREPDISHWTFGELKRDEATNKFDDAQLANLLKDATSRPAGAFGARHTPHVMRLHEIMGIESNRRWGVCSLNDFRKFLGLKTYSSFLEWNTNPDVARAAEKLYGHIDRLELYVGLQAEEAKPVIPGAAYTVSRAILADAIALTRGDRFFTSEFTPYNLTAWGFADCQRDPEGPGNGSMLGRLILRTLPAEYTDNSTYAWFPLMTPDKMKEVLGNLNWTQYDLKRPVTTHEVPTLSMYADAKTILADEVNFGTGFPERVKDLVSGSGFFIASNDPVRAARERRGLIDVLIGSPMFESTVKHFFLNKTRELMQLESCRSIGTSTHTVDIVRDVLRVVPIYWVADMAGIKLKSSAEASGDFTPSELFEILSDAYSFLFLDIEAGQLPKLRQHVTKNINNLLVLIRRQFGGSRLSVAGIFDTVSQLFVKQDKTEKHAFAERLRGLGYDVDAQCNLVLALMIGATAELSQAMVNVVNFYLDESKPTDVQSLCTKWKPGQLPLDSRDEAFLQGYVLEACRLDPTFRGVYRKAVNDVNLSQGPIKKGDRIFVDVSKANLSGQAFVDPTNVIPTRKFEEYIVLDGAGQCTGLDFSSKVCRRSCLQAVYSFKNLRRAPSMSGTLKRYKDDSRTSRYAYLNKDQHLTPWATSMLVQFDA